ncbi:LysR family transcriptional regulator [Insulibacter thermoxylanivorax]|uniref:LysR family transcriptional regulator n=1 Tax=Insulibacter thermoxylanivorax TaxID=2749268 RepID=A0A916QAQ2_9BACL|nr:LysR family transcriptional regulator [Insulibacter thermoxylanivorax]GFR37277.1 LysR family transcriptional regulator [Insulibacter thermoxylanivorax]
MTTKLDLYRVFCITARNGSISRAAQELYMSQSAVSQAIMQLENELDTRLFNRTTRGVTLTTEGSLLFEYAHSALSLIEAGEQKLTEFKDMTIGELKIGVGDTISKHFLLPYLEEFHIRYPNIRFKIVNGTTLEICALLKSGAVDLGVCNFPLNDPSLEQIPCLEVQDIFVCGDKYRAQCREPMHLRDIASLPLILLEPSSNSRKYVEDVLSAAGVKVSPEFELGSHDLLLEFAKINLGIACVIKQFARDYLEQQLVYEIPLQQEIPKRHIGICYLQSVSLSPASKKFVEQLSQERISP